MNFPQAHKKTSTEMESPSQYRATAAKINRWRRNRENAIVVLIFLFAVLSATTSGMLFIAFAVASLISLTFGII